MRIASILCLVLAACGDDPEGATCIARSAVVPADGTTHVSILTPIVITFDGPLAAPGPDALRVYDGDSQRRVGGAVVWDEVAQTLTFTPVAPLAHNRRHRLVVDAPDACAADASFTTTVNELRAYVSDDAQGAFASCTFQALDAEGRLHRQIDEGQPGPDATHCSGDEVPVRYRETTYHGDEIKSALFVAPGEDLTWFTSDDVCNGYSLTTLGPIGGSKGVAYGAGPDGEYFTADDSVIFTNVSELGADDRVARSITYGAAGPDGEPATEDDEVRGYALTTYGSGGQDRVGYNGAGPDGVWFTDDDVTSDRRRVVNAAQRSDIQYLNAGPDLVHGTDDDVVDNVWRTELDARGLVTRMWLFTAGGAEPTATSPCATLYTYSYEADGDTVAREGASSGPDERCDTADDVPDYHETFETSL